MDDLRAHINAQSWDAHVDLHQAIRNARPIPAAFTQHQFPSPVPVTAWIVWEKDGLDLVDTNATHWSGRDILVELLREPRSRYLAVWLAALDARRR
jgi:hypothetical protein